MKFKFLALIGSLYPLFISAQVPINSTTPYGYSSITTANSGTNGPDAYCPTYAPQNGNPGKTGSAVSYQNLSSINNPSGGSAEPNTGVFISSTGGTGGVGGNGAYCFAGYGGGSGGVGGAITVTNGTSSSHPTYKIIGSGIIAISTGGQGGEGGGTGSTLNAGNGGHGGDGGVVTLTNYGDIVTSATGSMGLYGLSKGGGGGAGGVNKNGVAGTGGNGMAGGVGGQVILSNSGQINTTNAYAMFGISVGGYGGSAGASNGFIPSPTANAGYGGVGGDVTITNNAGAFLSTNGIGQAAMFAVSVGGGGGDAGRQSSLIQFGANGGPGAQGGNLTATNSGGILTQSASSVGIVAISVGGGGGSGGMATSAFLGGGGSGGGGGFGGDVQVTNTGLISTGGFGTSQVVTSGAGLAPAISALSVGGGGGMGGYSYTGGLVGSVGVGGAGGDGGVTRVDF